MTITSGDDAFPAFLPDKDELKARLPLSYVCAQLGIHLNRDGRALCPWHERDGMQHSPSFYLWEGDDKQVRWQCQPCAKGGDIFDLLMQYEGLTWSETMKRAADMVVALPADFEPPVVVTQAADFSGAPTTVNEARIYAEQKPGLLAYASQLIAHNAPDALAAEWDEFLRTQWGWGLDASYHVYMPHWDKDGNLTGCKVRRGTSKDSIGGSKYTQLYGAWRRLAHRDVLITEGESDCVYADFNARKEGIPLDVRALPRGAGSFELDWLTHLKGAKSIFLAFDPDDEGVKATRVWLKELAAAGFSDIRVCSLPLGVDLKAARPTIAHLLAGARKPVEGSATYAADIGGYVTTTSQGNAREVTNWIVEPVARLIGGEEPGYDVILTHAGRPTRTTIGLKDMGTTQSLKRWAKDNEVIFTGTQKDVDEIAKVIYERGQVVPEIFQTDLIGYHAPSEFYEYLGPTIVYDTAYAGALPWRYVASGKRADLRGQLKLPLSVVETPQWRWRWLREFLDLSGPEVTHPLLAWSIASARRHEAKEFPMLFISGSSGVGKSTLARLALKLMGSGIETDLAAITEFALVQMLAATSNMPIFVDEWTRLSKKRTREAFQSYMPAIYAGSRALRGQADLTMMEYKLTAPVIVAGEDTFTLDRERDRVVTIRPSRATQNHGALAAIERAPLETFARQFHTWLVSPSASGLVSMAYSAGNRPDHNRDVLAAGWDTLLRYAEGAREHDPEVPDLPMLPDLSCFELAEGEEPDENVYEQALREGLSMRDGAGGRLVWPDRAGRGTWVRTKVLIMQIERMTDIELPGRSRAMLDYFRERYAVTTGTTRAPLGDTVKAALVLDLHLADPDDFYGNEPTTDPDAPFPTPVAV